MGVGWIVVMNVLQPRIMQDAVGIHPIVVLGSVLIGSRIAGIPGAIFGIPIAAVVSAFFFQFLHRTSADRTVAGRAARRLAAREGRPVHVPREPTPGTRDRHRRRGPGEPRRHERRAGPDGARRGDRDAADGGDREGRRPDGMDMTRERARTERRDLDKERGEPLAGGAARGEPAIAADAPPGRSASGRSRPRILVTNDDGVESRGLLALKQALEPMGDITVVAPGHQPERGRSRPGPSLWGSRRALARAGRTVAGTWDSAACRRIYVTHRHLCRSVDRTVRSDIA